MRKQSIALVTVLRCELATKRKKEKQASKQAINCTRVPLGGLNCKCMRDEYKHLVRMQRWQYLCDKVKEPWDMH